MRIHLSLAVIASGLLFCHSALADDPKPVTKPDSKPAAKLEVKPTDKADPKATKKVVAADGVDDVKGHLPPFYRYVVSAEQQTQIYKIHDKYADQVKDLKTQLETLRAKEEAEALDLLSPQQKAKLAKLVEDAKANKTKKPSEVAVETEPGLPKPIAKLPPKFTGKPGDIKETKDVKKVPEKK